MSQNLTLPLRSIVNGVEWKLFSIEFKTMEDQTLSAYFYATSFEHAGVLLGDLKETGNIGGCLCEVKR